jgi:hypothetical protein
MNNMLDYGCLDKGNRRIAFLTLPGRKLPNIG